MSTFFNKIYFLVVLHITFPVVNDGLPARIRACEARPGLANCGGVRRGSERSDRPSRTQPEPPKAAKRLQSC